MSPANVAATFVVSAVQFDRSPDRRPARDRAGRTIQRRQVQPHQRARATRCRPDSATPGKTRQVNVYRDRAGGGLRLLPDGPARLRPHGRRGKGATGVQQPDRAVLRQPDRGRTRASAALTPRSALRGVVLAVDARHAGMSSDVEACRWLTRLGVPFLLVATKVDKLSQSERGRLPGRASERSAGRAARRLGLKGARPRRTLAASPAVHSGQLTAGSGEPADDL